MNHIIKVAFGFIMLAGFFISCNDEDNIINSFSINREEITIGAEGGIDVIGVTSSVEWTVNASQPWITVSPANGIGSVDCTVSIDSTLIVGLREAQITFTPKGLPEQHVDVYQTGYGNIISLQDSEISIPASANYDNRYFELVVTTNVEFAIQAEYLPIEGDDDSSVTATEWLTLPTVDLTLDRGARPRTTKLRFEWSINTKWVERTAKIHFIPSGKDEGAELVEEAVLLLQQEAALEITDDRAGDSLAILSIREQLEMFSILDANENMRNWSDVVLWEKTDKDLPTDEKGNPITDAVGRVREVTFFMFGTKDDIPQEIKYLKYAEKVSFYGNTNTMLKSIDLGSAICELSYLKNLQIGAYGLVSLPDEFSKLTRLESLDLSANNFDHIPDVLCRENFPNLKTLSLGGNRRWTVSNLSEENEYDDDIGLHINMDTDAEAAGIRRLFLWEELETLELSYNYLEGSLPTFEIGTVVDGVTLTPFIKGTDFTALGDTVAWLWTEEGQQIPRILPNCTSLKINLNFFTGVAPNWILYHPYLIEWEPDTFIFNQMEEGKDSSGNLVKFSNAPSSYTYYYEAYPLYEYKYAVSDEE